MIGLGAILAVGVALSWHFGAFEHLSVENLKNLQTWFEGFGILAPVVFILLWIVASVLLLPGLPITLAGAVIFGAVWGSVYTAIGATLGATLAFLVGRYAGRTPVEGLIAKWEILRRIDEGVEEQGWRMLAITRLVPVFPFAAQNYVYGLTKIPLPIYVIVSLLCMLPATVAYNFAAGALVEGKGPGRALTYLTIAAVIFVLLSFIRKLRAFVPFSDASSQTDPNP